MINIKKYLLLVAMISLCRCATYQDIKIEASDALDIESIRVEKTWIENGFSSMKVSFIIHNKKPVHICGIIVLPSRYSAIPGYSLIDADWEGRRKETLREKYICTSGNADVAKISLDQNERKEITVIFKGIKFNEKGRNFRLLIEFLDGDVYGSINSPVFKMPNGESSGVIFGKSRGSGRELTPKKDTTPSSSDK